MYRSPGRPRSQASRCPPPCRERPPGSAGVDERRHRSPQVVEDNLAGRCRLEIMVADRRGGIDDHTGNPARAYSSAACSAMYFDRLYDPTISRMPAAWSRPDSALRDADATDRAGVDDPLDAPPRAPRPAGSACPRRWNGRVPTAAWPRGGNPPPRGTPPRSRWRPNPARRGSRRSPRTTSASSSRRRLAGRAKSPDRVPALQEGSGDVPADEARRPRDQDRFHRCDQRNAQASSLRLSASFALIPSAAEGS